MITVEKIGGTSMSQFGEVLKNIMLRDPKQVYGRVYVVSAYAGVTNELLEHKKTGAPGIYARFAQGDNYGAAMDALLAKLEGINKELAPLGLDLAKADGFLQKRMNELKALLHSMRARTFLPGRSSSSSQAGRVTAAVKGTPASRSTR